VNVTNIVGESGAIGLAEAMNAQYDTLGSTLKATLTVQGAAGVYSLQKLFYYTGR